MLAKDKNSSSVFDLQAFLSPEGYLNVPYPYEIIQCMVITKRVQGPITSGNVAEATVRVPKKAPAISPAANHQQQVLQVEETKANAEGSTRNDSETESEED
jgi:hypothetical protein